MKSYSSIKTSILLIVFSLIFSNCSEDNNEASPDLTGNWKVIYFLDNGEKITKTQDNTWYNVNNGDITINFNEPNTEGKGNVSGIRVSNEYNGNYIVYEGGKISFEQITQTEINEPDWTDLFNLSTIEHYQISNSILLLSHNNGKNKIAFERN
jgi:hypothetical protein